MADDEKTPAEKPPETDPGTDKGETETEELGDGGKKALNAERELRREALERAKAAEAQLAEFKTRSEESKTDLERLQDQVEQLTRAKQESDRRAVLAEVAEAKGLTSAQARRLTGSTREELEADADDLLNAFQPAEPETPERKRPRHRSVDFTPSDEPDLGDVADAIMR